MLQLQHSTQRPPAPRNAWPESVRIAKDLSGPSVTAIVHQELPEVRQVDLDWTILEKLIVDLRVRLQRGPRSAGRTASNASSAPAGRGKPHQLIWRWRGAHLQRRCPRCITACDNYAMCANAEC